MPRRCTVCDHDEGHAINVALVQRESYRTIANHYGVSESALKRHSGEHLPQLLVKARDAVESAEADDLLAELKTEKEHIQELKGLAVKDEDYRTALLAVDKALRALELQARVSQILKDAPVINLNLSPEWVELRTTLVCALDAYPEARESVLRALEVAGNGR